MWYLILLFTIMALPDFYIWFNYIRGKKLIFSFLYWLPLVVMIASLFLGLDGIMPRILLRAFFVLFLCVAIPKMLFSIISIIGQLLSKIMPKALLVRNTIAFGVAVLVLCCAIYGFTYGWKKLTVDEFEVVSSAIPKAFDDYKIVQLSDLHVGTFDHDPAVLDSIVAKVNALHPDLILFTGDLINIRPDELNPYMSILSELKAKDGVYSIMGNHDYCYYDKQASQLEIEERVDDLIQRQREMGWDVLRNEHRIIERNGQKIAIIGVENESLPPHPSLSDLPKALEGVPEDAYKILMTHDPSHWKREVVPNTDIPLTLSGHTHAMQVKIGKLSPAMLVHDEWGGKSYDGDQLLNVNIGTGGNVPFRFGAWPEIGLITLKSEKK